MSRYNVEILPTKKVYLGEGPHWDEKRQCLYYVDILAKTVHRYDPATNEESSVVIKEKGEGHDSVSLVVPVEGQPNKFVIGLGRSLRVMDWDSKSSTHSGLKTLHVVDDGNPNGRFNDGKCDSFGRLWAGTMGYEPVPGQLDAKKGTLYKLDKKGELSRHISQIDIANGLSWSPDDRNFYYIDTFTYRVDGFDYSYLDGVICNRRTIFDFKENKIEGVPDGMCIDASGNIWVAVFGGSKILHINPVIMKLIDTIDFPTKNITSVTFGGPNLDTLYVTSAQHGLTKEELAAQPAAGSLFKVTNVGAVGLSPGVNYKGKI